uniref:Uncharacterized protein n=1 Tax=Heterosigma akashiwo TaxID=2829 RepID=A0A6V1TRV0_HETAK|mmetsp:Transcript_3443/g.6201  ORF Transcript_3443/g.6201 Transcript_3443/m.6201 type:complete len:350 (-) Transcript_3443:494-1543(-)
MKPPCILCLLIFIILVLRSVVVLSFIESSHGLKQLDTGSTPHQLVLSNYYIQMMPKPCSRRMVVLSMKKSRRANNPKRIMQEQGYDKLVPYTILDDQLSFLDAQLSMLDDSELMTTIAVTQATKPEATLSEETLMLENEMPEPHQWATPVPAPATTVSVSAGAPAAIPAPAAEEALMEVFIGRTGIMVPVAEGSAMLTSGAATTQAPVPVAEERLKLKMVNVAGRDLMLPTDRAMEMLANGSARPIASERVPRAEEPEYSLVEVNVDGSIIMVPDTVVNAMVVAGAAKRTAPKPVAPLPVASAPKAPASAPASKDELIEVLIYGQSVYIPATQAGPLVTAGLAKWADSV